jgi:hypothetical protein
LLAGCAAEDAQPDGGDDARTWSVDSGESPREDTTEDSTATDDTTTADVGEVDSIAEMDTSDVAPDWSAIRCASGATTEAAFEGTTRNPSARLTLYVRDDCALIGTIATSMPHGNFSLALRGQVDDDGDLTMAGSNRDHQCDVHGALGSVDAEVSVDAIFDGASFDRDMTLQRIE